MRLLPRSTFSATAFLTILFWSSASFADVAAVLGTGRMGSAVGPRFGEIGYTVVYGSRTPESKKVQDLVAVTGSGATATTNEEAVAHADIIFFALPFHVTEELIKNNRESFSDKILFDITNASLKDLAPERPGAVDSSAGQLIQNWAPDAYVVKALNTVGFHIVADPSHAGGPVSVPLVGNDEQAKQKVTEIVQAMGFETADSGLIEYAHVTEGMAQPYFLPLARRDFDEAFEFYFRKGTAPAGIGTREIRGAD